MSTTTSEKSTPPPSAPASDHAGSAVQLKVYQHSDLLYWWIIWFYGFFCAFLTRVQGVRITVGGEKKAILFHPSAWVGISFLCLLLFVLIFTNARARGIKSMVLFCIFAIIGFIIEKVYGLDRLSELVPLLLIHMNLGFYVFFSTVLLLAWLIIIFGIDHMSYVYFAPSQVGRKVVFSEGSENFVSAELATARSSDDVFVHRILGLWFLGFGTGDLDVHVKAPTGERHYALKNVWRVSHIEQEINRLVRSREHVTARAASRP